MDDPELVRRSLIDSLIWEFVLLCKDAVNTVSRSGQCLDAKLGEDAGRCMAKVLMP